MATSGFHNNPYDAGTLTKLKIFELYVQEWIPVFVAPPRTPFREIHIFDLFCGPGTDSVGNPGSPLRIIRQLKNYGAAGMKSWPRLKIVLHLSDIDGRKINRLSELLKKPQWQLHEVAIETRVHTFEEALNINETILNDRKAAKLLLIDQYGVDSVNQEVFKKLIKYPKTDFIFFLSSSTLHRFRDHPAIKIKISRPDRSYDVHRAAFDWYKNLTPESAFLGRFSIKKGSNIYGLIFGSQHPLGAHKFLQVAWANDQIAGEADFDIDEENISPNQSLFPLTEFQPRKIQAFEADLETVLRKGKKQTSYTSALQLE